MNTFEIIVSLNNTNNKATIFMVVPHDNHENSYPTYFQLFRDGKAFTEIRLNDELEWEVCKGADLSSEDVQRIVNEIESNVFKQQAVVNPGDKEVKQSDKSPTGNWFEKIVSSFSSKKSAA